MTETTDQELLALAAKACGYTVVRMSDDGIGLLLEGMQDPWNPLENSTQGRADCWQMETLLKLDIFELCGEWWAITKGASTRKSSSRQRASVMAAAVIGRVMV